MMSEISRTGSPTSHGKSDKGFTWTVSLSAPPQLGWKAAFQDPQDWSLVFHPRLVRFFGGTMIFESDEQNIPTWMQYIDKWINSANETLSLHQVV